jgi:hypothetical protein
MKIAPIVERLKEQGLKRVHGVLELMALKTTPILPAFYVVPDGETAGPNRLDGGAHSQKTEFRFGVVIMIEGAAANQDRASDQLAGLQDEVIAALLGWTHPEGALGCDYVGARMLSVSGSTLSWMVSFRTGRLIRKVS